MNQGTLNSCLQTSVLYAHTHTCEVLGEQFAAAAISLKFHISNELSRTQSHFRQGGNSSCYSSNLLTLDYIYTDSSLWILLVVVHYSKICPPSARRTCKEAGVQSFVRLFNTEFIYGQLVLDLLSELRHRMRGRTRYVFLKFNLFFISNTQGSDQLCV